VGVHITSDYSPTTTTQKANSPMSISNNFTTCTRRAAFGFLGASSLVALLTACDDEDKPGARPSTTTSSATAPETEPPEPTDSPSAAPSSSGPKYSGKSKAPAGEFRAADIYGPAQNVPKPTNPPGYTEPTLDGMMKSMKAWTQWRNYGMQTGDYTEAYKFVSKNLVEEINAYNADAKLYHDGGWIIGGEQRSYDFRNDPVHQGNGVYSWDFFVGWSYIITVGADGRHKRSRNTNYADNLYTLTVHYEETGWIIDSITRKQAQK